MDTEVESSQEQVLQSRGSQESSSKTSLKFLIQLTILSVKRETLSLTKDHQLQFGYSHLMKPYQDF